MIRAGIFIQMCRGVRGPRLYGRRDPCIFSSFHDIENLRVLYVFTRATFYAN